MSIDIIYTKKRIYDTFNLLDASAQDVLCEILDRIGLLPFQDRMDTINELCRLRDDAIKRYAKEITARERIANRRKPK